MSIPTDPAARLQAAATLLRARLAAPQLTEGPWLSLDHGDRLLRNQPGDEDQAPVYVVNEPMSNGANADYIAAMHPGTGAAILTVLEQAAARITHYQTAAARIWDLNDPTALSDAEFWVDERVKRLGPALAVADAILAGGEQ